MFEIAVIGTGYWGPNIVNSLERTGKGRLRWLCDLNLAKTAALASRYPHARTTADYAQVLADPAVDAVFVVTPTSSHYRLVKQALSAGKHVLVEKPITTNSQQALELAIMAKKNGLILMVGHVFEYNASLDTINTIIKSGEIGEIYYMNFERTNLGPVRTDVNALWDLTSHDISIMCNLMGAAPIEVSASGRSYLNTGIEDVIFANFSFSGGVYAHVHASWLNPRKVRQITIVGSKKMLVWDDLDIRQPIRLYDKRVDIPDPAKLLGTFLEYKTMVVDTGIVFPIVPVNEPLLAEIDHFLTCLATGSTPISDGFSGLRVVSVAEAVMRSMSGNGMMEPVIIAQPTTPAE